MTACGTERKRTCPRRTTTFTRVLLCTMAAYCTTTLQGDKCTDSRCPYRHDILRCEPCERSLPASSLQQHQKGKEHLRNVASNRPTKQGTPQRPPPPQPSNHQFTPRENTSPLSEVNTPITVADSRVTVSGGGVLDFVAEGTGTEGDSSFPAVSHTILIEKTKVLSSLSVQSMTLTPSPSPWCERFSSLYSKISRFLTAASSRPYLARRWWSSTIRHGRSS